jgi:aryl-alcohol dehydrogenase-like predicted oxidoreductase
MLEEVQEVRMGSRQSRRGFLMTAGTAAITACSRKQVDGATQMQGAPTGSMAPMPMRPLGRTGVHVSLMGLGGFHLGLPSESEAIRIVHQAVDHGLTFLDNCWDYHKGDSERRMGKALQGAYRHKVFLMTKVDGRTADAAMKQIDESLRRLGTDHIDLVQIHEVIRASDPARVFAVGGAIEAFVRAREQGKIRFVGFTGHKSPAIHMGMLDLARQRGFRFDTVQMPLNVLDGASDGGDSFEKVVLPVLLREQIGVLGMKPLGSGIILESGAVTAVQCLRYAMSLPVSVTITGVDSQGVLEQDLSTVLGFDPMNEEEKRSVLSQVAAAAHRGKYEKYKTTTVFDGTTHNPHWLTSAQVD